MESGCCVCKNGCTEEKKPKIICRVTPRPNTRRYSKIINNFIIIEVYRCMPLLGNEAETAPNWDVHIVHYAIVFMPEDEVAALLKATFG